MSEKFKAIVLKKSGDKFSREIKTLDESFFKTGDVLVKVEYSSLNYKDALILKNGGKLVKEYPHIPGIDFSGQVIESDSSDFKSGDNVVLTGCRVGEIYPGGYSQLVKVKSELLLKKPESTHVVCTGRDASEKLIEMADLVTEMKMIKHPFEEQGIPAQKGIEF